MRLGFYTDTFLPRVGGAELMLHALVSSLGARGHGVRVIAPRVKAKYASPDAPAPSYPVSRYFAFSKRFGVKRVLSMLGRLHRDEPFDLLHCHAAYPPAWVAAAFRDKFGVPFVVRPHGSDITPNMRIRKNPKLEPRLREALRQADAVIAQGNYMKQLALKLGASEQRVHVIHNGVDLKKFGSADPFDHPRPYILALGNLSRRKGFDLLIDAYARLENPNEDLLIAGDGAELQSLQQQAIASGIKERVRFLGHVGGLAKVSLYRSAQLFVCPSRAEPFANVVLEAMASGLAVIASRVGGNEEMVQHETSGLLFESQNVEALTGALRRALADATFLAELRAAATARAADFDMTNVVDRYVSLYSEVCGCAALSA